MVPPVDRVRNPLQATGRTHPAIERDRVVVRAVKVVRPVIAEQQANLAGITRTDIATALLGGFEGATFGVYRERDELLPIIARAPAVERADVSNIQNVFVLESTGPAHLWVNGIRLQCAYNTEPEWWQPDKTCDLKPILAFP